MAEATGKNIEFKIYQEGDVEFHGLSLRKSTVESVVMSLGDKITGDVYYQDNTLTFTMKEYIKYNGVNYVLVNPPTIVREGHVSDNGDLRGMTKYSLTFYHPMYMLGNMPFVDVATSDDEVRYLSDSKTFSWIGKLPDLIVKLNKNLQGTQWVVVFNGNEESEEKANVLSDILPFNNARISEVLKTAYDTWKLPFVIDSLHEGEFYDDNDNDYYTLGKRFVIVFGTPSNEIYKVDEHGEMKSEVFVFKFGQGVGLKNDSRTPKGNKIVTRLAGYGSENNIPYGYPQIRWYGESGKSFTYGDAAGVYENVTISGHTFPKVVSYPIYKGILGGEYVELIKHPFTRTHLMPSTYSATLFNKVSLYNSDGSVNTDYDPNIELIDYIDAPITYPNPINIAAPSYEIHEFEEVKPELTERYIIGVQPYNYDAPISYVSYNQFIAYLDFNIQATTIQMEVYGLSELKERIQRQDEQGEGESKSATYSYKYTFSHDENFYFVTYESSHINFKRTCLLRGKSTPTYDWNDDMDDDGNYEQGYFHITLPALGFDLYACAAITQQMQINMRSGDCIGCTFEVQVDWEDYKKNFYNSNGEFDPIPHTTSGDGHVRDVTKYPDTTSSQITLIVKKDINTFGKLMPNIYQQPKSGDAFVILGISLPQVYVTNAESRLDGDMAQYLLDNNVYYHEYPLKFDEYFLAQNVGILRQMRNNTIVTFLYNNTTLKLYIKQMVVKFGEKTLPEYNITLTDDVDIVLNQIGQVTEDVSRIRVQLSELQRYYNESVINEINNKLSRVSDDIALGRITFQQGINVLTDAIFNGNLQSSDFESGMYDGHGWKVDALGNAEFESAKIRSVLEVIELLINRQQAQEGDTLFTDNDQIIAVEEQIDPTDQSVSYVLTLKEKWDGYITSQQYGNILKGIINTLAAKEAGVSDEESESVETDGENKYYTSWMRVTATHATTPSVLGVNQIRVVLYGDEAVPAQRNFEPCELMNIARWGCVLNPYEEGISEAEKESRKRRQQVFYISTTDGRITKLTGVNSPILQQGNYGTTLGTVPDFIKNWSIASRLIDGRDYLYAQGVIVGDFIKVNINGLPIVTYVDCGEWYDGGAQGATPTVGHGIYLVNEKNDVSLQWETHDVWYNGKKWRCLQHQPVVSGGETHYYPPKWNSQYWQMVEGSDGYEIKFTSSNGDRFRLHGNFSTDVTPFISCGTEDISLDIALDYWKWERCLASNLNDGHPIFTPEDETWNLAHLNTRVLTLTDQDMPSGWSFSNAAIFICTVAVNDGKTTQYIDNHVIV